MFEFAIIGLIVALIAVLVYAQRRRTRNWPGNLRRLHAGVNNKAEWMAPEDVIQRVELDYLNAQRWMADALLAGYVRFMNEAPLYLTGSYLKREQQNALIQMKKRGPRLIGILRAHHHVHIRHFSDDALTCYVLDEQTERRMATYDYWQLRRLHTQDLCDGVYVYRMVFDRSAKRWKIEELIQQLPMGWGMQSVASDTIRLQESLPGASGRDI
jgi:hypothetical protein